MTSQHPGPAAPSRRGFLGGAAALGAAVAFPAWPSAAKSARDGRPRGGFRVSLSVSPVTETVLGSVSLTDGSRTADTVAEVQRLFNRRAATEVFARVATLEHAGSGDAEYGSARAIERARLARDLGMPLGIGAWNIVLGCPNRRSKEQAEGESDSQSEHVPRLYIRHVPRR